MIVKLLTEHHLEFLSLTGGCRGLSESTLVKMSNCWKSHAAAQNLCILNEGNLVSTHNIVELQHDKTNKLSIHPKKTRISQGEAKDSSTLVYRL